MDNKIKKFLETISQIESSGGKNLEHKEIKSGIHEGHRAIGKYGLMPNTVDEFVKRTGDPKLRHLLKLGPEEKKEYIEANPQVEDMLATAAAQHTLQKQGGDPQKAAYSWQYGHNLPPEKVEQRGYQDDPYVQKFRKLSGVSEQAQSLELTDPTEIEKVLQYVGEDKPQQEIQKLPEKNDLSRFKKIYDYLQPQQVEQPEIEPIKVTDQSYVKKLLSRNKKLNK